MRKIANLRLIFLALAALLLVVIVACEDSEPSSQPSSSDTPAVVSEAETPAAAEAGATAEPDPGITDTKIILGSHFAKSGTYGAAFAPVLAGAEAYFKYVNAEEGGVCGREIDFRPEDDGYEPARAVEVTRKLIEEDKIFAMVAGLGTAAHSAVWERLNEEGIPDLWIMSGAHKWTADIEAHPWSIPLLPDYYVAGAITGKYISENMPGKKVGILYQNDDFGKDHRDGLKHGLDPDKNEVVSEQSFEATAVDIRSQVINLKSAGAEIVFGACIPGHCAQALKYAYNAGWEAQFFISYVCSDVAMFNYAPPEAVEGAITLQANKMYDWTDDPAVAEHHRIMKEYGTLPAANFTIVGHTAAQLTVEALRATCDVEDPPTRQGLMDTVHTIFKDYQGDLSLPGILTHISPTDHLPIEQMMMLQATLTEDGKGKWEYIGDIISFEQEE